MRYKSVWIGALVGGLYGGIGWFLGWFFIPFLPTLWTYILFVYINNLLLIIFLNVIIWGFIGALIVFVIQKIKNKTNSWFFGIAGGIVLFIIFVALIKIIVRIIGAKIIQA